MIEAPTPCKAQIELETLSAWRDRALSTSEYQRLAAHVATCTACQYRLHAFDDIRQVLQMHDTDHYQERIWHRLRTELPHLVTLRHAIPPRFVAAISVLILVALFALVTSQRGGVQPAHPLATSTSLPVTTPTMVPVATPIVLTPAQLDWQPTAPRIWHAAGDSDTVWFAPAPSDGTQSYVCTQFPGTTVVQLWKTNNRGENWLSLGTLPSVANGSCNLTVDRSNPDTVILGITQNARATPIFIKSSISYDGGKTWQDFLQGKYILDIAFGTSTSYAVLSDASSNGQSYLAVSRDSFKTWQKIMPSSAMPFDFWVSRTGELLLASDINKMWLTDDQGHTWHSISVPNYLSYTQAYQPAGSTVWSICGRIAPTHLDCSQDQGHTWHSYLMPMSGVENITLLGTGADDTIIISLFANSPTPQQHLYRFSPQLGQWQLLGSTPDAIVTLARTTNGAGILWAWYTADPNDDAQQRNFTALLP